MNKKKKILSSAKQAFSKELKSIRTLSTTFNNNFYKAVNIIHNLKGRVIVTGIGKSAHIGNKISATLSSTGTPSYFIHATEASHGDLGSIQKNDCVIAISNSGETKSIFREAMRGIVPDMILNRRDKIGFQTTQDIWLGNHYDWIKKIFKQGIDSKLFREDYLLRQLESRKAKGSLSNELWRQINFIRWCQLNDL